MGCFVVGLVFGESDWWGVDAREAGQVSVRVILLSPNSLASRIHIWSLIEIECRNDRGVGQYWLKTSALIC